jgi:hypothetical protein
MSITIIDNTTEQVYTILTDFAGAAVRAEAAADLSQAWAEGTEPGGAGTKSAAEHAADAGAAAEAKVNTHEAKTTDVHGITSPDTIESTAGAQAKVDAGVASKAEINKIHLPLEIEDYDGKNSITHPDVVFIPEGWNGWRYWMVYTPYPPGTRENPSIAVSNDGVDWTIPEGLTNPIVGYEDGPSGTWSDTDMLLRPDGKMIVYFRKVSNEKIYIVESTDGVNWTPRTDNGTWLPVLEPEVGVSGIYSPAVVLEDDDTYSMWSADEDNGVVHLRTSNDGYVWGAPQACTLPTVMNKPFHLDVVRVKDEYYMLLHIRSQGNFVNSSYYTNRLYHLESTDGINWTGEPHPAVPLDKHGISTRHYRSTFVPMPAPDGGIEWDMWISDYPAGDSDPDLNPWKLQFYKGVTLRKSRQQNLILMDELVRRSERIFVPATSFIAYGGAPTLGFGTGGSVDTPMWTMPDGATQQVVGLVQLPKHFDYVTFTLLWINLTTNSGDVRVGLSRSTNSQSVGDSLAVGAAQNQTVTALSQNVINKVQMENTSIRVNELNKNMLMKMRVYFTRGDAADTLVGDVGFLGVIITPAIYQIDGNSEYAVRGDWGV